MSNDKEREALDVAMSRACVKAWDASGYTTGTCDAVHPMFAAAFELGYRASLAANAGSEPVATIKSWTNGSYWRNYKVEWHRNDLPEGALLYTHPSPPEGMVGGWISVEERLPEPGQDVAFVVRVNSEGPFRRFNRRVLGGRFLPGEGFSLPGLCVDAACWMPLPPPPSAEGVSHG